jgi:sucrose-6-phosphate hydrolase SacC (GH32 family)
MEGRTRRFVRFAAIDLGHFDASHESLSSRHGETPNVMTKRWLVRFAMAAFAFATFEGRGPEAIADDFPRALVAWTPIVGNPVFEGAGDQAWDRKIRERGYILVEEGTYHLWYTGYNDDRSPTRFLGHATSPDGLRWTRDPANPVFTGSWTEDVCVLKRDGRYLMFAEGKNDVAHQLVSTDRVHWSDLGALDVRKVDGSPIPPGPYGTPTVWFEEGTWYLFYERGDQGVWLATSKDRQVWTNVRDTPVLALGPEPYDRAAVAFNQVIKRDGVYYAFYHANAQRPWKDWTTNIARSRDLVHWEKYPGNPIIKDNCSSAILVAGPDGDRLYTMHPDVKVFRPAATIPPR